MARAARIHSFLNGCKLLSPEEARQNVPGIQRHFFRGYPLSCDKLMCCGGSRSLHPARCLEDSVVTSHGSTELSLGLEQGEGRLQVVLNDSLQDLEVFLAVAKSGLAALQRTPGAFCQVTRYLFKLLASFCSYKLPFLQNEFANEQLHIIQYALACVVGQPVD